MLRYFKNLFDSIGAGKVGDYSKVVLSEKDINDKAYRQYLGGGDKEWESRGKFQLHFLRQMGMKPGHALLDIGCGPLRAGEHIIRFLDKGNYAGIDYNHDFIRSAKKLAAEDESLREKKPLLKQTGSFRLPRLAQPYSYILVFSVLNHCDEKQRRLFFNNLAGVARPGVKIFITHAFWFAPKDLSGLKLALKNSFKSPSEISDGLKMEDWGWADGTVVFPILELTAAGKP